MSVYDLIEGTSISDELLGKKIKLVHEDHLEKINIYGKKKEEN